MRDDSTLYTGASSASFAPPEQPLRVARRKEVQEKRIELSPSEEIIAAEFKKEVDKIMYAPYDNEDAMSDEQFRTERRARRLTVLSLLSIQTRINNIVRQHGRTKA